VLYRAVVELGFTGLRRNLTHFLGPAEYESCGGFLAGFARKITSASVVAELYRHIQKTEPQGRRDLWEQVYEEFDRMGMDEAVVRLLAMAPDLVSVHGPTDVSLVEIARQNVALRPVVFTLDSRLHEECIKSRIKAELLIEICHSA